MEQTEVIFWGLFIILTIGEILIVFIFKLPKSNVIRDWVEPAFEAIIIAMIIRTFIIQAFKIPTSSMEDTLLIGDHIIANKFFYGTYLPFSDKTIFKFKHPQRGEVIIFRYPQNPKLMFIKRCIGLPGDSIEIKDKIVYLNRIKLDEPYVYHKDIRNLSREMTARDNFGPVKVPPDSFFVMGDNRDNSEDSRFWGFLSYKFLRGKAWFVYWPPDRIKIIKHYKFIVTETKRNLLTTATINIK